MSLLVKLSVIAAVIVVALVFAWSQQRRLLYAPDSARENPENYGLPLGSELQLKAPDGVDLIAWYAPAKPGQPTLLYFHGNAGNLLSRAGRMAEYISYGYGYYMLSYRGYGGSGGKPTEDANVADAVFAYQDLVRRGVPAEDIILYGESLGSGVAVQVASQGPVGGVILDAPYTSIADVGALIYPFLPVQTLILDRYDSLSRISKINAPLLIVHGENDQLIPIEMGKTLFEKALGPKQMSPIPGAGHANHHEYGSYTVIRSWIDGTWKSIRQNKIGEKC